MSVDKDLIANRTLEGRYFIAGLQWGPFKENILPGSFYRAEAMGITYYVRLVGENEWMTWNSEGGGRIMGSKEDAFWECQCEFEWRLLDYVKKLD